MLLKLDWRISNFRHSRKQSNKQLTKMLDTVFSENWIFYLDIGGWISANAFYTCRSKLIAYCVEQRQTIAGKSNKIFDISLISFHQIFMRITRTHRGPWRTEDGLPLFCAETFSNQIQFVAKKMQISCALIHHRRRHQNAKQKIGAKKKRWKQ